MEPIPCASEKLAELKSLSSKVYNWLKIMEDAFLTNDRKTIKYYLDELANLRSRYYTPYEVFLADPQYEFGRFRMLIESVLNEKMFPLCEVADIVLKMRCPIYFFTRHDCKDFLEVLLKRGGSPNDIFDKKNNMTTFNKYCSTYIYFPANHLEIFNLLIKYGADVDTRDSDGNTPLHNGIRYFRNVKALLEEEADINSVNKRGKTPLYEAIVYPHDVEIVIAYLLKNLGMLRPHKICKNPEKHISYLRSFSHAIDHLVYCELDDINEGIDDYGNTLLHHAMNSCYLDLTRALLKRGANVHAVNKWGFLPSHMATQYIHSHREFVSTYDVIIDMCFDSGLDFMQKDNVKEITIFFPDLDMDMREEMIGSTYNCYNLKAMVRTHALALRRGFFLSQSYLKGLRESNSDVESSYFKECWDEMLDLESHKIFNNISLLDLLTKRFDVIRPHMQNLDFVKAFESIWCDLEKYPNYSNSLKNRYKRLKYKNKLIVKTTEELADLLSSKLPVLDVIEHITYYLNDREMELIVNSKYRKKYSYNIPYNISIDNYNMYL